MSDDLKPLSVGEKVVSLVSHYRDLEAGSVVTIESIEVLPEYGDWYIVTGGYALKRVEIVPIYPDAGRGHERATRALELLEKVNEP